MREENLAPNGIRLPDSPANTYYAVPALKVNFKCVCVYMCLCACWRARMYTYIK